MKILRQIRNYFCYCGIEKEEYKTLKKYAYVSNFNIWRVLHVMMAAVFLGLFGCSLFVKIMYPNRVFYLILLIYSLVVAVLFLVFLKKDSVIAQLIIYLSISVLFVFGCLITRNKPDIPATTFIVLLLIAPMFMIDKPYFMALELVAASAVYLVWMYYVKPVDVWKMDVINTVVYTVIGILLNVIASSIRIREFVLTRKIRIQKDTDELTGLMNKGAVTREIDKFLNDYTKDKGILFVLDIDRFKNVNDTYGHDVGDSVINQLGGFLRETFKGDEIVGRFGGDEFIVFIKDENEENVAKAQALKVIDGVPENVLLPNVAQKVTVSIGIALYSGIEKHYTELFKKADVALYKVKAERTLKFDIYRDSAL